MSNADQVGYRFRDGSRVTGVSADVAGDELERISRDRGSVTAEAVVEEATPEEAPLHPAFEWDDAKAAHEHRLSQARYLIRAVCVVASPDETPRPVYVHVPTEEGRAYQPVAVVGRSVSLTAAALAQLQARVAAAQKSVDDFLASVGDDARTAKRAERVKKHLDATAKAADKLL